MKRFKDRQEALEKLLSILDIKAVDDMLVISISENGNYYAREIAMRGGLLEGDFLFIEEIKSPENKETSLAAISETKDYILINELIEAFEITDDYIFNEAERVYEEKILQNIYKFRGGESIISLRNRNVLLVDEGANTGLTLLCAIKSCISKKAASINVAVPVIAKETARVIEKLVDNTFFVYEIEDFVDTDFYFKEK
ncbi:phosphoribosyltransferase family protein [Nautilia sp.]